MNKQEPLSAIRWDVSGFAVGLLLGAAAFWLVRPKGKAASAFDMARRWLSWGVFAGFTSGTMFFFRHYDQGGIIGAAIGVVFWSGLSWFLGFLWGLVRFGGARSSVKESLPSQVSGPVGKSSSWFPIGAAVAAALLLGLVGMSAIGGKNSSQTKQAAPTSTASIGLRHIAQGFLLPGSTAVDERKLATAVEAGDAQAQYLTGLKLIYGDFGFLAPRPPGFDWHNSGLPGETPCLRDLGKAEAVGDVAREGFALIEQSAEQGYAPALFAMYECYVEGLFVNKDERAAGVFLQQALDQDFPSALLEAANRFSPLSGIFFERNLRRAYVNKAAALGHPAALYLAGQLAEAEVRNRIKLDLTREFWREHVLPTSGKRIRVFDNESPAGAEAFDLALREAFNDGQLSQALDFYSSAAGQGYAPAMYEWWSLFVGYASTPAQKQSALEMIQRAAATGFSDGVQGVYITYVDGEFAPKDDVEALAWAYAGLSSLCARVDGVMNESSIKQLESALTPEARRNAQIRAKEICQDILAYRSIWLGESLVGLSRSRIIAFSLVDPDNSPPSLFQAQLEDAGLGQRAP